MKLIQWLRESKISQSELARRLNVTPACISMLVHGKRRPGIVLADKIISESGGMVTLKSLLP